jgi:small subunit ribosomal protein S16
MATKIRLARHGRKQKPYYHIVVADSRAPRDGRFIEKLGSYNPNTNPATVTLNFDGAVNWLEKGAQPTDTTRAILSYEGALMRVHLNKGVLKGAMTQEQADAKFTAWKAEKAALIEKKVSELSDVEAAKARARMEAETARRQTIQERVDAKLNPVEEPAAEEATEAASEEVTAEAVAEETTEVVEAPAEEAIAEEPAVEEVVAEVTEEPVVEETTEEVVAEATEEAAPESEGTSEEETEKA